MKLESIRNITVQNFTFLKISSFYFFFFLIIFLYILNEVGCVYIARFTVCPF